MEVFIILYPKPYSIYFSMNLQERKRTCVGIRVAKFRMKLAEPLAKLQEFVGFGD